MTTKSDTLFCYVTCPNEKVSNDIAYKVVSERLAACANIFPSITSVYHWEGKVQNESESVLILKTRNELLDLLSEKIKKIHPYDCPCIVALPIRSGNPAFLEWIYKETNPTQESIEENFP